jgi:hypothetical protein
MTEKAASVPHSGPQDASKSKPEWPRKVRTTLRPNEVVEVGPAEYADLSAWDLIKSEGN